MYTSFGLKTCFRGEKKNLLGFGNFIYVVVTSSSRLGKLVLAFPWPDQLLVDQKYISCDDVRKWPVGILTRCHRIEPMSSGPVDQWYAYLIGPFLVRNQGPRGL